MLTAKPGGRYFGGLSGLWIARVRLYEQGFGPGTRNTLFGKLPDRRRSLEIVHRATVLDRSDTIQGQGWSLYRPQGPPVLTSNSRTAHYGPACPGGRDGPDLKMMGPIPIAPKGHGACIPSALSWRACGHFARLRNSAASHPDCSPGSGWLFSAKRFGQTS